MTNWKINLTGIVASSILIVACGGGVSTKPETVTSKKPTATPPSGAASPKPAKPAGSKPIASQGLSGDAAASHNSVRSKHNLNPLTWSDSLASYAGEWANHLANQKNCNMEHRSNSGKFKQLHGENLYWAGAVTWSDGRREVQNVSIKDAVKAWADEEQDYNYANNSCKPGKQCGHYTQIVWKKTTAVGCAYKVCGDKSQIWVCNYSPAGNYIGQKPY